MDEHMLHEFLAEAEDLLEVLFGDLQALRVRHGEGRARRELIGRIFRHTHTLKGSAATAGLERVAELSHEFESLLDGARMGRVRINDEVLDVFDATAQSIQQALGATARHEQQPETKALIQRLRTLARAGSDERASSLFDRPLADLPEEIARSLSKHEAHRLRESLEEGAHLFLINVSFHLASFDARFRDLSDALAEKGEIICTLPGLANESPDKISFRIVYATEEGREDLTGRAAAFGELSLAELTTPKETKKEKPSSQARDAAEAESAPAKSIASLTSHLRVELAELDAIISAAHDLLVETTGLLNLAQSFKLREDERVALDERAKNIRRNFIGLEEQLISLRMIPVGQILERAARAGRLSARATGKEVGFEAKGGHVKLDKALADVIADPLLHILRNAVDHGIELPTERARIGKRPRGLVRLEAGTEGNRVSFKITDDGRGIDPLRVTRAAAAQGIIKAGRLLTKEQALRLIFRPGFSTAVSVSKVSGRGVGLDVVERAVEQVGGELRISSEQGAGTTFEIILPTTLALLPTLVIRSSGHSYCIEARRVVETGTIARAELEGKIEEGSIDWRGSTVPLVLLRKLLAQAPVEANSTEHSAPVIIVSQAAGRKENGAHAAIVVDSIEGETEALVRGLGRHATRWRGVSGATELRDGTIALVLDLPRLLEMNQ